MPPALCFQYIRRFFAALLPALAVTMAQAAPTAAATVDVRLWHGLTGPAAAALADLTVRFNAAQAGKAVVRLEHVEPLSGALPRPGPLPQLALFDASATMAFFGTRPRLRPLDDVMRASGRPLSASALLPQIAGAVDDFGGRLQALPMALSVPVLLVNRGLLTQAGIDATTAPPATWAQMQEFAGELQAKGIACPLASSHFAWIHLENLAAQAGEPMVRRSRAIEQLTINGYVPVKHLALLASWQKSRYFNWHGPGRESDARFLDGECAMLTGTSALHAQARSRGLDVYLAPLPHHDDVYAAQAANVLPDGESLWVLAGNSRAQDALIARFVRYWLEAAVQREWVAGSGFLPMTPHALSALRDGGAFPPDMLLAVSRRLTSPRRGDARVAIGAARERYRQIVGEEIATLWTTERAPKEALDRSVTRNEALPDIRNWSR